MPDRQPVSAPEGDGHDSGRFGPARAGSRPSASASAPSASDDAEAALGHLDTALTRLGYDAFRPGQRDTIETLMHQRRVVLVAPTGGGKSLCYQAPALCLGGTTLVVSPLIALMHDQVQGLQQRGIDATFFASTLDGEEMRRRMAALRRGRYQIVYAAPERLMLDGFRAILQDIDVPLIAVDEAHCISEWGHDFRPEYMRIGELLGTLPNARVLACTATATPVVRDEICARLGLPATTPQLVRGFARPNLALAVRDTYKAAERHRAVDDVLLRAVGRGPKPLGTAIVYAPTRKAVEEQAVRLQKAGYRAGGYHAGLDGSERERVQNAFIHGRIDVAVATNAFGMGIDRGDVRAVVHLAPPGSIEAYYQEVGRAGRDGAPAEALLCLSPSDVPLRRHLLRRADSMGNLPPEAITEHKWNLFLELMRWAEGGSCRHDAILRYFGDEQEALAGCGRCDICVLIETGDGADAEETTLTVRKALSGVARVHGRFGLMAAVQLLGGQSDERLVRARLTDTRTFGVLKDKNERWLLALLRRCVSAGWVDFVGEERPIVVLTPAGRTVMLGEAPARIVLPRERVAGADGAKRAYSSARGQASAPAGELLDGPAVRVFDALRAARLELAREAAVPPYVVASDRTLRDLAMLRPVNLSDMQMAHGIGPSKVERFGAALLAAIQSAAEH